MARVTHVECSCSPDSPLLTQLHGRAVAHAVYCAVHAGAATLALALGAPTRQRAYVETYRRRLNLVTRAHVRRACGVALPRDPQTDPGRDHSVLVMHRHSRCAAVQVMVSGGEGGEVTVCVSLRLPGADPRAATRFCSRLEEAVAGSHSFGASWGVMCGVAGPAHEGAPDALAELMRELARVAARRASAMAGLRSAWHGLGRWHAGARGLPRAPTEAAALADEVLADD